MRLNSIGPAEGAKRPRRRVGRGIGSGLGKTCGRGHKGQTSRTGTSIDPGFEGGQMPLKQRLPKFGFTSLTRDVKAEVRLSELALVDEATIDLLSLKAASLIPQQAIKAKVILSGSINKAVTLKGVSVTKGARAAIEAAGGKVEE